MTNGTARCPDTCRPILSLVRRSKPKGDLRDAYQRAQAIRERLRAEMIALQEEMDWLVYAAYGLLPENHPAVAASERRGFTPAKMKIGGIRPMRYHLTRRHARSDFGSKWKAITPKRLR